MQLSGVTLDDGRAAAMLVQLIGTGRWDLSGKDAEALVHAKTWLASLATQMATQLRQPQPIPPERLKIKTMPKKTTRRR